MPKLPKSGTFSEVQKCGSCGDQIKITFEEIATLGDDGNSSYAAVEAEYV